MTREEKHALVNELTETIKRHPNFLVLDTGGNDSRKNEWF
ncbi:MAG: hypothetical protein KatS3mg035_1554 [Bacteroidia bacterium]|nr:MAG: hypothetical protein KatS3mg035_1554 [Bacteroidia bacterium]